MVDGANREHIQFLRPSAQAWHGWALPVMFIM
jgi:hypothetical protein